MGFIRDSLSNAVSFVREEIMPIRGELIKAGILSPLEPRGYEPKSNLSDPFSYSFMGYGYKERFSFLDYAKLRQISYADPIVSAIIQTRMNQVAAFAVPQTNKYKIGFKIQMRDKDKNASKVGRSKAKEIEQFILACGFPESFDDTVERRKRDSFESFLRKITRDSLTFDQLNFEVVPRNNGQPAEFIAVDAGTIRLTADKRDILDATYGTQSKADPLILADMMVRAPNAQDHQAKHPRLCQVIRGQIVTTYDEWEMAYGIRNPRTDILANGYGFSEIEMLVSTITAHINAETYNKRFFSQGCLPHDVRIATEHGYVKIGEAFEKKLFGKIWNGRNWTEYDVVETGLKQLCETDLSGGQTIRSSPDHKFRVYLGGKELGWKKQSDLKPGDVVVVDAQGFEAKDAGTGIGTFGRDDGRRNHDKARKITIDHVGSDLWEFLGWIMGDGYISDRGIVSMYNAEDERHIRDRHAAVLSKYGLAFRFCDDPRKDRRLPKCQIMLSYCAISEFAKAMGFDSGKFKGEHLPEAVFRTSAENRRAFIRGLFSADGDTCGNNVKLTSACPQIIAETRLLLSSVGLQSYVAEEIRLYVNQPMRFMAEIGFIHDRKSVSKKRLTYGSILPQELAATICAEVYGPIDQRVGYSRDGNHVLINEVAKRSQLSLKAIVRFRNVAYHDEGISRLMLLQHLHDAEIHDYDGLLTRGFAIVEDIRASEESVPMYDVRCYDDVHEFVAEGVVTHNSSIKGVLAFEGQVPPDQLEAFRRQWHQQVSGVNNAWRTPILSLSKDTKLNWVSLHSSNRDMEWGKYMEYLIKSICGVFQIDPIEIGFDISRNPSGAGSGLGLGGGFAIERIQFSQDKGLLPILRHIAHLINDYVVWRLDPDFEFTFVGHDQYDEKDDVDIEQKAGQVYKTVNEIRAEHDLPKLPDAEDIKSPGDVVLSPTFMQAMTAMSQQGQQGMMPGGQPGAPGGAPGAGGPDDQQAEPDYANMSTDDLQKELAKLQGGGGDDKGGGKPQPGQPDQVGQGGAGGVAAGRAQEQDRTEKSLDLLL